MALMAGILIAAVLIGISVVLLACTRLGRKARQPGSTSQTEAAPIAQTESGRSDLQGPHHLVRPTVEQSAKHIVKSQSAVRHEAHEEPAEEFASGLNDAHRDFEEEITSRLDQIDQLITADEEDLNEMERYLKKNSKRDRSRNRRRSKHRDEDSDQFDAE